MHWIREEHVLRHYLFRDKIYLKMYKQNFARCLTLEFSQEKPNLSMSTQFSCHRISKQPQQDGRKTQIWQEEDCKMSWQCGCAERFRKKESKNVTPKTFPRTWSFPYTIGKRQSISTLVVRFDFSEVICLLFKTHMKDVSM